MVLTIKNFESQNVGPGVTETAPTNLVGVAGTLKATLTWTSATGESGVTWTEEKLVRKEGSAPQGSMDGTTVATITTKDTYSSTGYEDTGLDSTKTYYYKVFAIYDNGTEKGSTDVNVTPEPKTYTTMTIKWQETSNPADFFLEYLDDAAGLTQGSEVFDEFFGYSAVRLNASGVETAEVTQAQSGGAGKLDMSQLGTLTSGDNVMIKFPTLGVKMEKSGSTVTLSLTKEANKAGYQYYAHSSGTLSNPGTPANAFYLGVYEAYNNSGTLKSWSGKTPTVDQTQATSCSRASANGSGYNIIGYYQRQFVNALYMMKYGNPDSQTVVGRGFVDGNSARHVTGGLDSQLSATWGETAGETQCKLFGLEDWWGNVHDWIGGVYTDGNKNLCVQLSGYSGAVSGGESTGSNFQHTGSGHELSSIVGNNKVLFGPSATAGSSSYNTYYCDDAGVNASCLACAGGRWRNGSIAGAFLLYVYAGTSYSDAYICSRLMYLPVPAPTLLSYEEIAALQNSETQDAEMLAELNTAPYEYYSSFSGSHIINGEDVDPTYYSGIKVLSPNGVTAGYYGGWLVGYYPSDYPIASYRNTWNIAG